MKRPQASRSAFAICVDNSGYPASLELHKVYRRLPDKDAAKDGDMRIIDESGEDYLYPAECFMDLQVPRETARALSKSLTRRISRAL